MYVLNGLENNGLSIFNKNNIIPIINDKNEYDFVNKNIKKYNYGLSDKNSKLKMKALFKKEFIQSGGYGVVNNKDNLKNLHTEFAVFKKADDKFKYKKKTICLKISLELMLTIELTPVVF